MNNCPTTALIFISIASYRDRQLTSTIEDLLEKAERPERLRFGICWQHGGEATSLPYLDDARFRILDVDWRQSRGACWARAEIMQLWNKEDFYFQIDSHCRFALHWDTKLIRTMAQTQKQKPVLSTYGNPFTPREKESAQPELLDGPPHSIVIAKFTSDGIPELRPLPIHDFQQRTAPVPARFLSGGFLFALGRFVEEVPYDPELYFMGEESSMSLRAFTSGYDLFHPIESLVWHDYVRTEANRHWQDHDGSQKTQSEPVSGWSELDTKSRMKVTALFAADRPGSETNDRFGIGGTRTVKEFECYAGIDFRLRRIQDYARLGFEPPDPKSSSDWAAAVYPWIVRVRLEPVQLRTEAFSQDGFWMVLIEDEQHQEIVRQDFASKELSLFTGREPMIALICEFESGMVPAHWTVWPFSREGGWGVKASGKLADQDFAIVKSDADA